MKPPSQNNTADNIKIFLISPMCSGKSHFTSNHDTYKNIKIVDFDRVISKYAKHHRNKSATQQNAFSHKFFFFLHLLVSNCKLAFKKVLKGEARNLSTGKTVEQEILAHLHKERRPVCVLAHPGPSNPDLLPGILFGAVLIPDNLHRQYCKKRALKNPNDKWGDYNNVERYKLELIKYTEKYNIPCFESFELALDYFLNTTTEAQVKIR